MRGTVKDINQVMAVRIKVEGQSRISSRHSQSWWGYSQGCQPGHGGQDQGRGTVKDIIWALAVIMVGYSQGYQTGHGGLAQVG
jgi:hypothetical protein